MLDSVKTQILSNSDLQNDFAPCIVLFQRSPCPDQANKIPELNVSAVNTQREGMNMTNRRLAYPTLLRVSW